MPGLQGQEEGVLQGRLMAADPKCPVCGSLSFFVKDPADEYETHEFTLVDGRAVCADPAAAPAVKAAPESFCGRCSWHGRIRGAQED
jgi:hypothetical protein